MKKKHVLLVTDSYPPEIRSASHLMYELATGLMERGYNVTVITTVPEYNLVEEKRDEIIPDVEVEEGVRVIRVKTLPIHHVGFLLRGVGILSLPWYFVRGLKKYLVQKVDQVLVYSPPLPLTFVGEWIAKTHNAGYVLNVQDLFPQNAIDLGILRNTLLVRFFEWMERRAYKMAHRVTVHSKGNLDFLLKGNRVDALKTKVLHNWIDIQPFDEAANKATFRERYGLEGKFIFLFAGVIGPAQGLDIILEIAQRLRDHDDIVFLFVGDGTEKETLLQTATAQSLTNVQFQPFVSREEYAFLVKEADVGLICLSAKMKTPVVPGKLQGYMAAGLPVLGLLNGESDGFSIIHDSKAGFAVKADDIDLACQKVLELFCLSFGDKETMGRNGRAYVQQFFTKDACLSEIEELFFIK